jgi:uncharacterized protein YuzE
MKIEYDAEADVLMVYLREGHYAESDQVAPNIVVDFDADRNPLAIEILNARSVLQMGDTFRLELPAIVTGTEAA